VTASSHTLDIRFDAQGLVANAGLVLPATLAQRLGLRELLCQHVHLGKVAGAANPDLKAMTAIASLLAAVSTWTTSTRSAPAGWAPRSWVWRRQRHRRWAPFLFRIAE
jgi:hypothetical protein